MKRETLIKVIIVFTALCLGYLFVTNGIEVHWTGKFMFLIILFMVLAGIIFANEPD